jgi:hypothetical protein
VVDAPVVSTTPEQPLLPHSMSQLDALHVMFPEQALLFESVMQFTTQLEPPQTTLPPQELLPHSMSQLPASLQSTTPSHPPSPHCTTHGTFAGQTTEPVLHLPAQSITHLPFVQVPLGHV